MPRRWLTSLRPLQSEPDHHFTVANVLAEAQRAHAAGRCFGFPQWPSTAELASLVVSPAHRREGLGQALVFVTAAVAAAQRPVTADGRPPRRSRFNEDAAPLGLGLHEIQGSAAEPSLVPWYRRLARPLIAHAASPFIVVDVGTAEGRAATMEAATDGRRVKGHIAVDARLRSVYAAAQSHNEPITGSPRHAKTLSV